MNGASKILTVSYGTFSCTLEGFDDPFNTMRAIAEYFRDLAADDRYFGAEPPTPDAAMLHRIAEREINRRVEANVQENGVILRAGDVEVSRPVRPATAVVAAAPTLADAVSSENDSVAARLSRLREAEAEANVAPEEAQGAPDAPVAQPDIWQAPTAEDTIASVMAGFEDSDPLAEAETAPPPLSDFEPEAAQAATWPVVDDVEMTGLDDLEADEAGPDLEDGVEIDFEGDSTTTQGTTGLSPEDTAMAGAGSIDLEPMDEEQTEADRAATDDDILRSTLGAMIDPEGDDDFDDAPMAATVAEEVETAQVDMVDSAAGTVDLAAQQPAITVPAAMLIDAVAEPAATPVSRVDERQQRARARVIKIRRIEVGTPATPSGTEASAEPVSEAAPAQAPAQAVPETATPVPPAHSASALTPEAEADLMRELADLEADLAPKADPAPETAQPRSGDARADAHKPADTGSADDSVNRLITQTNAAMEGPENKRRLAAIAHLKAAVAATVADRKTNAGPAQPGPAERMDPYRDDLDRVVRPRRPALIASDAQDASPATARPQLENRPAPLVLVSEQRMDKPAAEIAKSSVAPVRPRRVTSDTLMADPRATDRETGRDTGTQEDDDADLSEEDVNNIFSDPTQPFAEFAERLGAATMPELIEAAAAYCALQLGRDQFTRPLLLQQIADLPEGDDYNREDCLRGFGTLLRDGRIEKIKRGQFKLSGQSRYLAEARRQAG